MFIRQNQNLFLEPLSSTNIAARPAIHKAVMKWDARGRTGVREGKSSMPKSVKKPLAGRRRAAIVLTRHSANQPAAPQDARRPCRLAPVLGGSGAKLSRPLAVSRTSAPPTLAP